MAVTEEAPLIPDAAALARRRRCPECGNYLFLEKVPDDGCYWWSCLICGWHRPAEGLPGRVRARAGR